MTATGKAEGRENRRRDGQAGAGNFRPALAMSALLAKCSFYKILAVSAVMAATEGTLFFRALRSNPGRTLEALVDNRFNPAIFLVSLGAVYWILTWTEGRLEDKSGDTLLRLRLSHRQLFLLKTAWNLLCLALLFVIQIWLIIGMLEVFARESGAPAASSWQLFLASYRSRFFHCLLPGENLLKWARNLLLLLAFAAEASFGVHRKNYALFAILPVATALWFISPIDAALTDAASCALYAAAVGISIRKAGEPASEKL